MSEDMKLPAVTATQAQALADSVLEAYVAGWDGNLRKKTAPKLAWVTRPTATALCAKRLLTPKEGYSWRSSKLTKIGVVIGEREFQKRYGRPAETVATERRKAKQKEAQEKQDKLTRAKYLFRGMSLARTVRYRSRQKTMAAHIDYAGGGTLSMTLDDIIRLGEQIEALRG